jgi:20S proteasome subunit beta 1
VADAVHQHAQLYAAIYGERPPVATVAALFEKLCYDNKDQLSAGIIVAGWDKEKGGSVYNIPLGGGTFQQPWAIGGESSESSRAELSRIERSVLPVCWSREMRSVFSVVPV